MDAAGTAIAKEENSTNAIVGAGAPSNIVDGACVVESERKTTETTIAIPGDDVTEPGVVNPVIVLKKQIITVPGVSRKGRRAIGACILSMVVGVLTGVFIGFHLTHSDNNKAWGDVLGDICGTTLYPATCNSTLSGADTTTPQSYVSKSMSVSMVSTNSTLHNFTQCLVDDDKLTGLQLSTLQMCVAMYQDIYSAGITFLDTLNSITTAQPDVATVNDLEQRASAALVYHFTCARGLQEQGLWGVCGLDLERSMELLSNTLSLVGKFKVAKETSAAGPTTARRRLLLDFSHEEKTTSVPQRSRRMLSPPLNDNCRPPWRRSTDRRILQSNTNGMTTNAVVAIDGSGDFKSIQAAVEQAPSNSSQRYVIYIKAGTYEEQVVVPGDKIRLTLVGDGAGKTIVTGNVSSRVHNVSAVFTATVTIAGDFFMATNLTIRNTAGPDGREAVALRVTSHQSAFTWLSIEGYQNTLYAHSSQQFYSFCTISGTVDTIVGSAAAIFQTCSLLAPQGPTPTTTTTPITYTASTIASPVVQKHAGLVFQECLLNRTSDAEAVPPSQQQQGFLGRPGDRYARTVFLKSTLGAVVSPPGWTNQTTGGDTNPSTVADLTQVEMAEWDNTGPGSSTTDRVPWSQQVSLERVVSYGVDAFLKGNLWLPAMNVTYSAI